MTINELLNNGLNPDHGRLSTLLEWHKQNPVDEYVLSRNIFEKKQDNRNTLIDYPEWAVEVWEQAYYIEESRDG